MLFVSVKKYNNLKLDRDFFTDELRRYTNAYDSLWEQHKHLKSLRALDKECIQALLDITGVNTALGPYEKSLVDQTLNQ